MAKDKNTPKNKTPHRQEQKADDSYVEITGEASAPPQVHTAAEFQETFDELKTNCSQWATKQSELWEQQMIQHRNVIVESKNKAITDKIQPKIDIIEKYVLDLEEDFNKHKAEALKTSQATLVVKDLQKNMSRTIEGFDKRFERLAQINRENTETIGVLHHKLEAVEQHLTCFSSRMDVLHESLDENEKRWMSWESGDKRMNPCYRYLDHKKQYRRTIVEETEDESLTEQPRTRMYGGGPQRGTPMPTQEEGATVMGPQEGTSQNTARYKELDQKFLVLGIDKALASLTHQKKRDSLKPSMKVVLIPIQSPPVGHTQLLRHSSRTCQGT